VRKVKSCALRNEYLLPAKPAKERPSLSSAFTCILMMITLIKGMMGVVVESEEQFLNTVCMSKPTTYVLSISFQKCNVGKDKKIHS
jgi:hypothetical protein